MYQFLFNFLSMYYDTLMPMVWKVSVEKWEIKSLQHIVTEEKLKKLGRLESILFCLYNS